MNIVNLPSGIVLTLTDEAVQKVMPELLALPIPAPAAEPAPRKRGRLPQPVFQRNKGGVLIKRFDTTEEAAIALNTSTHMLYQAIKEGHTHKGFRFTRK